MNNQCRHVPRVPSNVTVTPVNTGFRLSRGTAGLAHSVSLRSFFTTTLNSQMFGLPFALAFLLFSRPISADPIHVAISRRSSGGRVDYAAAADIVRAKYGYQVSNYSSSLSKRLKKRASTSFQIIDQVRHSFLPSNPTYLFNSCLEP